MAGRLVAVLLACSVGIGAQDTPNAKAPAAAAVTADTKAPVLSELQQVQFTAAALAKELWLMKVKEANQEYQKAGEALDRVVQGLQVPGYDLAMNKDGHTLEYVKQQTPPKEAKIACDAPSRPRR